MSLPVSAELPNWSELFLQGLQDTLRSLSDSLVRLETKVDAVHDEAKKTNGSVIDLRGRVTVLEEARKADRKNRADSRNLRVGWLGPIIGAVTGSGFVILLQLLTN